MKYNTLPTMNEITALWPLLIVLAIGLIVWIYAAWEDSRQWREWQKRMRKRERENNLSRRFNTRN